jgi:hypothetical protein
MAKVEDLWKATYDSRSNDKLDAYATNDLNALAVLVLGDWRASAPSGLVSTAFALSRNETDDRRVTPIVASVIDHVLNTRLTEVSEDEKPLVFMNAQQALEHLSPVKPDNLMSPGDAMRTNWRILELSLRLRKFPEQPSGMPYLGIGYAASALKFAYNADECGTDLKTDAQRHLAYEIEKLAATQSKEYTAECLIKLLDNRYSSDQTAAARFVAKSLNTAMETLGIKPPSKPFMRFIRSMLGISDSAVTSMLAVQEEEKTYLSSLKKPVDLAELKI